MTDHISPTRLDRLRCLIDAGQEARFYWWPAWQELREAVMKMDNHECQICRGTIVHHVKHLRERPDLALSIFDPDTGERQLITVCKACHEEAHPESLRRSEPSAEPLTVERWD